MPMLRRWILAAALTLTLPALAQKGDVIPPGPQGGGSPQPSRVEMPSPPAQTWRDSSSDFRRLDSTPDSRPRPQPEAKPKRVVAPQPLERCREYPRGAFWAGRDLFAVIQALARRGAIPVVVTDPEATEIVDYTWWPAGWRAYAFLVAPLGELQVRLHHPNEGWFRLQMMNQWGQLEQGMLQNLIPTGNPEVSYRNPKREWRWVYLLVDDPAWWSSKGNPYTLKVTRSWDPKLRPKQDLKPVEGIWAAVGREVLEQTKPKESFAPEPVLPAGEAPH